MKKGFTLIELLVVVLIIGILASIALPQYTKAVEKSRSTEAVIMLKNIMDSANRYYLENGTYSRSDGTALTFDELDITLPQASMSTMASKNFNYKIDDARGSFFSVTATRVGTISQTGNYIELWYRTFDGGAEVERMCKDKNDFKTCKAFFGGSNCTISLCTF
ncbi:prepilin-type N-terminal cleavage/methylation domain-containing protein [Elusimicrobium posterum]|uniref:type IV pilin protein n=1 Tax=Elusimicrobium posterum TaxID=3116653 RepID=UPI003C738012